MISDNPSVYPKGKCSCCHHHAKIKKKILNVGSVKIRSFSGLFLFLKQSELYIGYVGEQGCVVVVVCFLLLCGVGDVYLCCFSDHFS